MTNRQRAERLAKGLGVKIIRANGELTVQAPEGQHWADGSHELIAAPLDFGDSEETLWQAIADDMEQGLVPCEPACYGLTRWPQGEPPSR